MSSMSAMVCFALGCCVCCGFARPVFSVRVRDFFRAADWVVETSHGSSRGTRGAAAAKKFVDSPHRARDSEKSSSDSSRKKIIKLFFLSRELFFRKKTAIRFSRKKRGVSAPRIDGAPRAGESIE
jgi:hypothetical protein